MIDISCYTPPQKERKQMDIGTLIKQIEEACVSGRIHMYESEKKSEESIRKAFAAFQNRRNELSGIHSLCMSGNSLLIAIPLLEAENIHELHITYGLTELPEWICEANSLCRLSVSSSNIATVPDWIGNLKSLTSLTLGNL